MVFNTNLNFSLILMSEAKYKQHPAPYICICNKCYITTWETASLTKEFFVKCQALSSILATKARHDNPRGTLLTRTAQANHP